MILAVSSTAVLPVIKFSFNVASETLVAAIRVVPAGNVTIILPTVSDVAGSTIMAYCVPLNPIVEAGLALKGSYWQKCFFQMDRSCKYFNDLFFIK
jgi:hypothetical protein